MTDRNVAADRSRYTDYSAVTAGHTGSAGCRHSADRNAVAAHSHLTADCTVLAVEYSFSSGRTAPAAVSIHSAYHSEAAGHSHSADYCTDSSGHMHLAGRCSATCHIHLADCTACSVRTYLADYIHT